jgi:hypothetical protein
VSNLLRERSAVLNDFSGGLNNYWDASTIKPNEVPYLINMEFSPNGALVSRPPIVETELPQILVSGTPQYIEILGYFSPSGGDRYLVAGAGTKTYRLNLDATTPAWTELWANRATGYTQYDNKIVLCKSTTGGAYWAVGDTAVTAIPDMPALDGISVNKSRFFGWGVRGTANDTKIYYSELTAIGAGTTVWDWNIDSVINVGLGDGQPITGLLVDYTNIYVFKSSSTYAFTYDALPEEGTVSLIQQGIGAENKHCYANYQNGYVVLHDQTLYRFQSGQFAPLNAQKVNFAPLAGTYQTDFAVSVFADRAIIWFNGSIYVLNLLTGTWAQWETTTALARVFQTPRNSTEIRQYEIGYGITASTDTTKWKLYQISNSPTTAESTETFTCKLRTRIYDFETPAEWKRLYWWAADIAADGLITATVTAIAASSTVRSWDQLSTTTWDILDTRTWDKILSEDAYVTTERTLAEGVPQRALLKLEHSIRFRRAYFEVYFSCDGTAETSPAQIFSITPMIGVKAKMTKGVA